MRALLALASVGCFGVALFAYTVARSDLQLSIAFTGLVGGFALAGLAALLGKLSDLQRMPRGQTEEPTLPWDERREPPLVAPRRRRAEFERGTVRPPVLNG